ncbi:MAG: restriction endonuclease subunit S [Methylophaga sp.]|uniref:restriction endonuclease subunit S n=1 Tax=Methylophaga sp. TaxID=2024840 RepID=UPI000C10E537|nr:restriction endonuclease subunit S [Methylophaga sp.]MBL1458148.1 restriction endonuclease subunit S [Methylophaga sp.]
MSRLIHLEDVCSFMTGGTPKTSFSEYYQNGHIPWIVSGDIHQREIYDCEKRITNLGLEKSNAKYLPKDSVLIALNGQGKTRGTVALLKVDGMTCNQSIVSITPKKDMELDVIYLFQILRSMYKKIRNITGDKDRAGLNIPLLKSIEIPLPPIAEQKQIAAILDAADSLRQKDQQLVEHYTALSQSLFLEMFGDPVTNTMGWDLVKLGNVCGVGSSKRVFVNEFVESGVPFYRGTEVGQLGSGQSIKPHLFISEQHYERFKKESGVPQIGDLLLPSICHDGRIWRVTTNKPFYFKDGRVLWIKVDSDAINSAYLRCFLKGLFLTKYSNYASGTTFAELKIVALKGMAILNPPIQLQNQFAERISIIEQQKQQAQTNLQKSEALFNSLLQRAFTGELTADKAA